MSFSNSLTRLLQGRFMNHPLHPILVHLPVGLWVAAFVFDILQLATGNPSLAATSYYCILLGLIGAGIAATTGIADFLALPEHSIQRRIGFTHLWLNILVIGLFTLNLLHRFRLADSVPTQVTAFELFLTLLADGILALSGFLGGTLTYSYGAGQNPRARDAQPVHREHPGAGEAGGRKAA